MGNWLKKEEIIDKGNSWQIIEIIWVKDEGGEWEEKAVVLKEKDDFKSCLEGKFCVFDDYKMYVKGKME